MDIKINNTNAAQSCIDQNASLYRLQAKKYKRVYIFLALGFLFCVLGLFDTAVWSGLSIFFDFGIVFIFLFIYSMRSISVLKRNFEAEVLQLATIYHQGSNTILIQIDEHRLLSTSDTLSIDAKWNYFKQYTPFENYIFISSVSLTNSTAIDKRMLTEIECAELLSFLNSKLALKHP